MINSNVVPHKLTYKNVMKYSRIQTETERNFGHPCICLFGRKEHKRE